MRAVVQRVTCASVSVGGETVGSIGTGLAVLLGIGRGDGEHQARQLADKIANLRVFADGEGKFNRSALDIGGEVLVISQFTLFGDASKGRRPSFVGAAPANEAEPLVERVIALLKDSGLRVESGRFGAHMLINIFNDGPVTIILEE